jgi:hypothetical protein
MSWFNESVGPRPANDEPMLLSNKSCLLICSLTNSLVFLSLKLFCHAYTCMLARLSPKLAPDFVRNVNFFPRKTGSKRIIFSTDHREWHILWNTRANYIKILSMAPSNTLENSNSYILWRVLARWHVRILWRFSTRYHEGQSIGLYHDTVNRHGSNIARRRLSILRSRRQPNGANCFHCSRIISGAFWFRWSRVSTPPIRTRPLGCKRYSFDARLLRAVSRPLNHNITGQVPFWSTNLICFGSLHTDRRTMVSGLGSIGPSITFLTPVRQSV